MAARSNITRAKAQSTKLLTEAQDSARATHATVKVLSEVIRDTMKEATGGVWTIDIDYETSFILIRQRRPAAKIDVNDLREAI